MTHNTTPEYSEIPSDFTSSHIAFLLEYRQKAIAILRKEDVTPSELRTALAIEISIEKQFHALIRRRDLSSRVKSPKKNQSQPDPIILFTPAPETAQASPEPPSPANTPFPTPKPAAAPIPSPKTGPDASLAQCHARQYGYTSKKCTACDNGVGCPLNS